MSIIEELHPVEVSCLAIHEETIERGLATFYAVGNALLAIRDDRLYRATYATFEDYCRERWGIARRRAYQLMEAAEVVANVQNFAHALPANEAQARELAALPPELQGIVWGSVLATAPEGRITATHVAEVVNRYNENPPPMEYVEDEESGATLGVLFSSASPEWYTPAHVIAAVLDFFDEIDLDPCSNSHMNPAVPARQLFTKDDDGLAQDWWGRVYINPPYGDEVAAWVEKAVASYHDRSIEAAILLVAARTDTDWFAPLLDFPICFIHGRLKFDGPNGTGNSAGFPSALCYLGDDYHGFAGAVAHLGPVVRRYDRGTR